MRIAHFVETFSLLSETFIYDSIMELERQGQENHVLTLERRNGDVRPYPNVHLIKEVNRWDPRRLWHRSLIEFGLGEFGRGEEHWTHWPLLRSRITSILQHLTPEVIHAQFGPAGALIAPVAQVLGVPLIITFHGYDITILPGNIGWKRAYQDLFEQAAVLLGVSSHICTKLMDLGAPEHKVKRFFLGVDLNNFIPSALKTSVTGKEVRCLHVGRLVEKKGPLLLVDAFKQAREQLQGVCDLRLTVVGDGPLRSRLEDHVGAYQLEEAVDVLGAVSHERVSELMRAADLYTQHSLTAPNGNQEGLPVSLMEAAATGLPIVSTWHSGIPDLVRHEKTGLLVQEGDVDAMAESIVALAKAPERRHAMGQAGRRYVEMHFDLAKQTQKLAGLYEACAERNAATGFAR
jgi:colanic acid/amylovoran biosynthesis glycosyltransferase